MTPALFELMKTAARSLLEHHDAGRHCDPRQVAWARKLLADNPRPIRAVPYDDDLPPPWSET